ncbi:son of sevenless homolog 1 isoform X1 [Tachysurus ichikawai]
MQAAQCQYDFFSEENAPKWKGLLVPSLNKYVISRLRTIFPPDHPSHGGLRHNKTGHSAIEIRTGPTLRHGLCGLVLARLIVLHLIQRLLIVIVTLACAT